ncbi:MAG: S-methyl-5-thioribose-1-phosphate isomerase, partial [Planctomycetes bacterium]|nr:S-methyl-5-thioribose-1-phosphate isomerase [Planctomycetota bacterium]
MKRRLPASQRRRSALPPPTLEWKGGVGGDLLLLDQTRLPARVRYLRIRDLGALISAIRALAVRGAPAIGCAAAYGMVIGLRTSRARTARSFARDVERVRSRLAASRPTAVNLFWALDRMAALARAIDFEAEGLRRALERLLREALAVHEEDRALCRAIGGHGAALLRSGWAVLTHCNAGALATGGMGTALAVIYRAVEQGKKIRVYADETRPLLQGARLTSWELAQAGIPVTLICDGAAASVIRGGLVDCALVGADRIALNGDVANKVGT